MIFQISDETKMILETMHDFVREELYPLEEKYLIDGIRSLQSSLEEKRKKARDLDFWLPQIPKEFGGMGFTLMEHGYVSEILGRSPLGHYVFNCQAPDAGNMEILIEHGTDEQKETFLSPLLEGEIRSCFAMTE